MEFRHNIPSDIQQWFHQLDATPPTPTSRAAAEAKLYLRFPALFRLRHEGALRVPIGFGLDCGPWWWPLIWRLCEGLEQEGQRAGLNPGDDDWPCLTQIKEKYGTLRCYIQGSERMQSMADMAEECSAVTCEECGRPGSLDEDAVWWQTLCPIGIHPSPVRRRSRRRLTAVDDSRFTGASFTCCCQRASALPLHAH